MRVPPTKNQRDYLRSLGIDIAEETGEGTNDNQSVVGFDDGLFEECLKVILPQIGIILLLILILLCL